MTFQELMHEIGEHNYVIVGVSPQVRYPRSKPKIRSGHLVLIVGYDRAKQEFYLHNPSGISKETQEYAVVKFSDFKKFFSGRSIVIQVTQTRLMGLTSEPMSLCSVSKREELY
jgi:hypothetical protein